MLISPVRLLTRGCCENTRPQPIRDHFLKFIEEFRVAESPFKRESQISLDNFSKLPLLDYQQEQLVIRVTVATLWLKSS